MTLLIVGLVLFLGIHSLPMFQGLRQSLMSGLGEKTYQGVFALIALAGFVIIIFGKAYAAFIPVWQPPLWTKHITMTLMLPALILLPAANMPGNIKRFTRHPMLWGVFLWGAGHLAANGDLASMLLFGTFAVYALVDMASANYRGAGLQQEKQPFKKDMMVVVAGVITYGVFVFAHPYLFGVAIR